MSSNPNAIQQRPLSSYVYKGDLDKSSKTFADSLRNYAATTPPRRRQALPPRIGAPRAPAAPSLASSERLVNRVESLSPKNSSQLVAQVAAAALAPQKPEHRASPSNNFNLIRYDSNSSVSTPLEPAPAPSDEASLAFASRAPTPEAVLAPSKPSENVQINADRLAQFVSVSGQYFSRGRHEFRPLVDITDEGTMNAALYGDLQERDAAVDAMVNSPVRMVVSNLNTQIHVQNFMAGTLLDNANRLERERGELNNQLRTARNQLGAAQNELKQALKQVSIAENSPAARDLPRLLRMPPVRHSIFSVDGNLISQIPQEIAMPDRAPARALVCSEEQAEQMEALLREVRVNYDDSLCGVVFMEADVAARAAQLAGGMEIDRGHYDAVLTRSFDTLQRATARREHLSAYTNYLHTQIEEIREQTIALGDQREQIATLIRDELLSSLANPN